MNFLYRICFVSIWIFLIQASGFAQPLSKKKTFTHQDTLRGSINAERSWWNVVSYTIWVKPDFDSKSIVASNEIGFAVTSDGTNRKMQIDLQEPLTIDSIWFDMKPLRAYSREGNVYHVDFGNYKFYVPRTLVKVDTPMAEHTLKIFYHGNPRIAVYPPWDGGWIFTKDDKGRPWMSVACQGLGASVWYPCKDHQSDEPDRGAILNIQVPDSLVAVGNGKLIDIKRVGNLHQTLYSWQVKNPINNYDIIPYIGKYVNFSEIYNGEKGKLNCNYWVLDYDLPKAKAQFGRDVKRMLQAFEFWFGPYPFYEDDYKLVEAPHLGMEHQSATAYGNHFQDGYLGMDLSGSGWGLKWDYIIVHESGHEWFGNSITTNDIADMWVHEGFAMYSEALFIDFFYGNKAGDAYVQGIRHNISNDIPVIGKYGVNQEGSGDMYNKGANMLHTIRQVINDDTLFRKILRGLNKTFYHKTIDSRDLEKCFSQLAGVDFSKVFDQYLRTTKIPTLEYKIKGDSILYRWTNCVDGFNLKVKIALSGGLDGQASWISPIEKWQAMHYISGTGPASLSVDKNFYINVKKVE